MEVKEWLGENNTLGQDIWYNKYRHENESLDEWFDRVSGGDEELKQLIKDKKFLFGGRILSNRGLNKEGKKITYSNCYVLAPPDDSIESIFNCAKDMARTFSYGGGVGIDISNLAPRGAKVNNAAESTSGAVSFMDLYSLATELIGQHGRRGALMISIDCHHPDVEEFIEVKSNLDKVTKANISIRVTDDFLEAVRDNADFKLSFTREETGEVIEKVVRAKDLFDKFCQMDYDYAEPSFLYWDRIENWNMLSECSDFEYAGTNPCFTSDMKLLTNKGYMTFRELNQKNDIIVIKPDGSLSVNNKVWCSGEKDIIKVKFTNGKSIKCTPNHIFMLNNGEKCEAKDLKNKRCMPYIPCGRIDYVERYVKYGFIQGDGQTTRLKSNSNLGIEVNIGKDDNDIFNLFKNEKFTNKSNRAIYLDGYKKDLIDLGFSDQKLPDRPLPTTFNNWSYVEKLSFLKGLFSANGCVVKHYRVQFKSTCNELILQLQSILSDLGINSNITINKSKKNKFNNGQYVCKQSYDLAINQYKSILKFNELIGFVHKYKNEKLIELIKERSPYVVSVTSVGKEKVYDFTENTEHWGIVNDCVVHNCAEEPLPKYGSCLLGSINLSEFVKHPFTDDASFNYESFDSCVWKSIIALNNVLDEGMPLHPLPQQRQSVKEWRQIGLGIMGLADMLIKMGITYGGSMSLSICDSIGYHMINAALQSSAMLAHDFGTYPAYDEDSIMKSNFYKYNANNKTKTMVEKYGLRNSQLLTIPPCGSIATMIGVSGGIEPIFANYYTRKTESLNNEEKYYKIFTPIAWEYLQKNNLGEDETKLPSYFITSEEINYRDRVDMQSTWQYHIDASISSTVNLPNETPLKDVEDLYLYAWEKGLKGITIYRAGCKREGILVADDTKDKTDVNDISTDTNTKSLKLKRGDILNVYDDLVGEKRKLISGCGSFHLETYFDELTAEPMETFINIGSSGSCERNLQLISRLMSLCLRAGVPIECIIDQCKSIKPCPAYVSRSVKKGDTSKGGSCPNAIGFALEELCEKAKDLYLTDDSDEEYYAIRTMDDKTDLDKKIIEHDDQYYVDKGLCPNCHTPLKHEGGCMICECGWSKCD